MSGTPADDQVVTFHDTTLRDGIQSLWGITPGLQEGILSVTAPLLNNGNFISTTCMPLQGADWHARYWGVNVWERFEAYKKWYPDTPLMITQLGLLIKSMEPPVSPSIFKFYAYLTHKTYGDSLKYCNLFSTSRDELTREFPIEFPVWREYGIEPIPYIMYTVSPKRTDEYYGDYVNKVATRFKPVRICLEDVGGLLTVERAKTLIPIIIKNAQGIQVELHLHGMGGYHQQVAVEAMKMGIRRFQSCIPPLANGASLPSVYNLAMNARALGLVPQVNEEPLKIAEQRLRKIAQDRGFKIGEPREYDERIYLHRVPGGVIANLEFQLKQIGLLHREDEILDEIARIVVDLGDPIMMTPHSQFIVTQATMNVALGERYKEILDAMTEYAMGIYGVEDTFLDTMNPNVKDRFLSNPNTKRIAERWKRKEEEDTKDLSFDELKTSYGMAGASDEVFWDSWWGMSQEEMNALKGAQYEVFWSEEREKIPMEILLDALSKEHDISRLQLRKGKDLFDFRTK